MKHNISSVIMSLVVVAASANIFASEPITVEPGDIDALTNALKQANATVRLKAGVYDFRRSQTRRCMRQDIMGLPC